ncbi:NAD(P)H-binding protein [Streptomyces sp. ST2-7A]|uniref:NAD(P)H-binding protein n=1 Tax=Streptomyces sp. ST2-7A TaxID=2907214 RepID=UPI001F361731|nr:NAD(P)H-binding protein [Streptomyces sp. ST2-7A]MCE7083034.1 NAD(P)H-binding protein [Streptomyces sp. ST2-7A]
MEKRRNAVLMVTGAGGGLGGAIVERLTGRRDVIAGSRRPEGLPTTLPTRRIDFEDPASLRDGFTGVRTLLLVSAGYGEDDTVIARHGAAIDAAERAGVRRVVYTSLTGAGDHLPYALPHRWTERRLREGRAAWTILRNGLYAELLAALAAPDPEGRITAPLGEGRLAAVARRELAEAAARVAIEAESASTDGGARSPHAGRVYELVGPEAIGGREVADLMGGGVRYEPGTLAGARERVAASGAAAFQVPMLVGTASTIAAGFLAGTGGDLPSLLGREPAGATRVLAELFAGAGAGAGA